MEERAYYPDGTLGRVIERVDPTDAARKRITDYIYDTTARLRPDGKTISGTSTSATLQWRYGYDVLGRLTSESLDLGANSTTHPGVERIETRYFYDALDRVTAVSRPDGTTIKTDYDEDGNPWRVWLLTSNGFSRKVAERRYDAAGRMVSEEDAQGNVTTWTHDEMGNVLTQTDANGHTVTHEYDAMGRRTRTIDPNGNQVATEYDAVGDVASLTTAAGTTRFVRDVLGRVTETISPLDHSTMQRYDPSGNVLGVTDANVAAGTRPGNASSESVTTQYDALGRAEKVTDAKGGVTRFEYDLLGNRTAVVDAKLRRTSFAYNDLGQLTTITDPLGRSTTLTYDTAGQVATRTDRNGRVTSYVYDAANRLIGVDFASTGAGLDEERHYNVFGDLAWVRNASVKYTFTYDSMHRPSSRTDSRMGKRLDWFYDDVGNVIRRTGYERDDTTLTYDSANRVVAMSNPEYLGATYHYDGAGRLLNRIFSNGTRTNFAYDADSRLTEMFQYSAAGSLERGERYCYDAVGNITKIVRGGSTCAMPGTDWTSYAYEDLYQLEGEDRPAGAATRLTFDGVGNILTAYGDRDQLPNHTYTYDAANRLTEVRHNGSVVNTYEYDFEGNRTAKRGSTGALLASYSYDDKNRLVTVQQAGQTTTYTYDPFDYRIGMQHDGEQLLYHLDGEHIDAIYNVRGDPVATFLRGAVIDEIVGAYYYDTRGKKTFYTYSHDRLTSVASLADHTGAMVESYTYSPFGVLRSTTGGPTPNRLQYTGREQDPNGLYYYRARYYDPATRRFLTEDPLGFAAGVNFYAYAGNNPLRFTDPSGQTFYYIGVQVAAGLAWGGSYQVVVAFDSSGTKWDWANYYILTTWGIGGHAGADYSLTGVVGGSTADRPRDVEGTSLITGGSAGQGTVFGVDVVSGFSESSGREYHNLEFSAGTGGGPSPLNLHGYGASTTVRSIPEVLGRVPASVPTGTHVETVYSKGRVSHR